MNVSLAYSAVFTSHKSVVLAILVVLCITGYHGNWLLAAAAAHDDDVDDDGGLVF